MGTSCSKICKKRGKDYTKKNGKEKRNGLDEESPQLENNVTEENKNSESRKENNENRGSEQKSRKRRGRRRKGKHKRKSDESSASRSSSSSSSNSSSSSDNEGKTTKSEQKKTNKNGRVTYISNKTETGNNKTSFKAGQINIYHQNTTVQQKPEKSKEKPFQSYYSDSKAKKEENRQFASPWGQNNRPPGGNFIDTRDLPVNEYVFESKVLTDAASWVCKIHSPGGSGTGFRVGSKYIMTASHVVKFILDSGYEHIGQPQQNQFVRLQDPAVYAVFGYIAEGQQISEEHKFRFKDIVHFSDDETDTAILELEDNSVGNAMPLSFTYFSLPHLNKRFQFIGHPGGERMQINHVDRIIDINSTATQRDIVDVKQLSQQHISRDYEFPPHHILTSPHRYLFHCRFSKGASGSPGVIVLADGRVVVVTMLLCGFPDWFYDRLVPEHVKNAWPKENCVEQGVNFKSVYERMLTQKPDLCRDIFIGYNASIPAPNI